MPKPGIYLRPSLEAFIKQNEKWKPTELMLYVDRPALVGPLTYSMTDEEQTTRTFGRINELVLVTCLPSSTN